MTKKKEENRTNSLLGFGNFLKKARLAVGIKTQSEAIAELAKVGCPMSYADMCRHEKGEINHPSPLVLHSFAAIYTLEYAALVLEFMMARYGLEEDKHICFLKEVLEMRSASDKLEGLQNAIDKARGNPSHQ